jgi:hypothetical protein
MPDRKVGAITTGPRAKFRWSDDQILKVIRPRALRVYTDEEWEILTDLAVVGADHILARRAGGRTPRQPAARGEIRRILIRSIFGGSFRGLPPRLRKTPTAPRTLEKVRDILKQQYGFKVSEATVLKDVQKIGTRKLRGK